MKTVRLLTILICAVMTAACCYADIETVIGELSGDTEGPSRSSRDLRAAYCEVLDHLVPLMASDVFEDRVEHQNVFSHIAAHAGRPDAEKEREALCEVMAERLTSATTQPARVWMIRQMENIGDKESVSALADCLEDKDGEVREVARRALETNPSSSASKVLRKAIEDAEDARWRIGLVNSLGRRADTGSVRDLAKMLEDDDDDVAAAVAGALGNIANSSAIKALFSAREDETGRRQTAITKALLDAGSVLIGREDEKDAAKIYDTLLDPAEEPAVRAAALGGLTAANAKNGSEQALGAFESSDPILKTAAIQYARATVDSELTSAMATALPDLSPAIQLQVLGLLADQGDESTQPAVVAMVDSADLPVRLAAIGALRRVANDPSANVLLRAAVKGGEDEKAAMHVLARLPGDDVPAALLKHADSGDESMRVAAINGMKVRHDFSAARRMLKYAAEPDPRISRAALDALGTLGGDSEISGLIDIMFLAREKTVVANARASLVAVCRRSEDKDSAATRLISRMSSANVQGKCAAFDVLRVLATDGALKAVTAATVDKDAAIRDAAIGGLCNWPDYVVMDVLLDMASDRKMPLKAHMQAVAGIVRLLKNEDAAPDVTRLEDAKKVLKAARRLEETKRVISALPAIPLPATADLIISYIDNLDTAEEAAQAALTLAENTKKTDRATSRKLVQYVIDKGLSPRLTEQAEKSRGNR
jgi:HEAT repeat protein